MLGVVLGLWASPAPGSTARSSQFAGICQWHGGSRGSQTKPPRRPGQEPSLTPGKMKALLLNEGRNGLFERRVVARVTHGMLAG